MNNNLRNLQVKPQDYLFWIKLFVSWIYTNEFSKLFFLSSFLCVEEIIPPPCLSIISNGNELNSLENKSWNTQAEIATVSSGRTDNNKGLIEWGLWDDCSLSLSLMRGGWFS